MHGFASEGDAWGEHDEIGIKGSEGEDRFAGHDGSMREVVGGVRLSVC